MNGSREWTTISREVGANGTFYEYNDWSIGLMQSPLLWQELNQSRYSIRRNGVPNFYIFGIYKWQSVSWRYFGNSSVFE